MDSENVELALRGLRDQREAGDDRIPVLIKAVRDGRITELSCAMPVCVCPNGRAFFTPRNAPRNSPWGPSADRWPLPGREGGLYRRDNVRLAHRRCNQVDGGRAGGTAGKGVRHNLSTVGRAALVERGKALAEIARTPEGRERSRQNGLRHGPAAGRKGGPARARRAATPEGRASLLAALSMARQTPEELSANARKGNCRRWNVGRGKACTCGAHE